MILKCQINGINYDIVNGATFSEELNETLDSGSIIIPHVRKIDILAPYDDVLIWDSAYEYYGYDMSGNVYFLISGVPTINNNVFFKHLLVDKFQEEEIQLGIGLYNYTIYLMSETKGLEGIPCPNISITQSLNKDERRTCYDFIEQFLTLYSPKYKYIDDAEAKTWVYAPKYRIDPRDETVEGSLRQIFGNVNCPEMSWSNPTLRDVFSQIMNVCDCIPIVHNGIVKALDISKTHGTFRVDNNHINWVHSGMQSGDYTNGARREYSGALSQTNSKYTEYLGFRNDEEALLTLDNMYIKTSFPIYKINKLMLCFYKNAQVSDSDGNHVVPFLYQTDISDLILQNNVRNALPEDWTIDVDTREKMHKTRICTLGYDIGSNVIAGWGHKYTYHTVGWFDETKTYLENILIKLLQFDNFGNGTTYKEIAKQYPNYTLITSGTSWENIICPINYSAGSDRLKTIFFKIEYEAMYDGAIIHGKENAIRDDILTVDNQGAALTLVERDGLFEHEKLKRLGNRNYTINGRYDSYEQMNNEYNNVLGSIYGKDVVIFHKEYTIHDSCVLCNFIGTAGYVLRNYFTSVFAKLRMYNYMSYGEAVKRADNDKKYVMLSLDKLYYENTNNLDLDFSNLISFVNPSYFDLSINQFVNDKQINGAQFGVRRGTIREFYSADIQRIVSGYSLCFNLQMKDNISGGMYIDSWVTIYTKMSEQYVTTSAEAPYILSGDLLKGSMQQPYVLPRSLTDAFIENMYFLVGHQDVDRIKYPSDSNDINNNIYPNYLEKMPKANDDFVPFIKKMGGLYNVCKDNKEYINMTFQLEFLNGSVDRLFISEWTAKLNDLYGEYIKVSTDDTIVDYSQKSQQPIIMIYGRGERRFQSFNFVNLRILSSVASGISNSSKFYFDDVNINSFDSWFVNVQTKETYFIRVIPQYVQSVENNGDLNISCKVERYVRDSNYNHTTYNFNSFSSIRHYSDYIKVIKFENCGNDSAPEYVDYMSENSFYEFGVGIGHYDILTVPADQYTNVYKNVLYGTISDDPIPTTRQVFTFPYDSPKDINVSNGRFIYNQVSLIGAEVANTTYLAKNMYLVLSDSNIDKQQTYQQFELEDIGQIGLVTISALNEIIGYNSVNNYIEIDLSQIEDIDDYASIQYWYLDTNGDNLLHFVMGVDLTDEMKEQGYVRIYISLLNSIDTRVFDQYNRQNYRVIDYIGAGDISQVYGEGQYYQEIEQGYIKYSVLGTSTIAGEVYYSINGEEDEIIYPLNVFSVIE